MVKKRILLAALTLLPLAAEAQMYRCTDAGGKVRYSEAPGPGCKPVAGTAQRKAPNPPAPPKAAKGASKSGPAAASKPAAMTAAERARRASDCKTMQEQLDWLNGPRGAGIENRAARIGQVKAGMRDCP